MHSPPFSCAFQTTWHERQNTWCEGVFWYTDMRKNPHIENCIFSLFSQIMLVLIKSLFHAAGGQATPGRRSALGNQDFCCEPVLSGACQGCSVLFTAHQLWDQIRGSVSADNSAAGAQKSPSPPKIGPSMWGGVGSRWASHSRMVGRGVCSRDPAKDRAVISFVSLIR